MNIHLFTCKTISLYTSESRHISTASQQRNKSPPKRKIHRHAYQQTHTQTFANLTFCLLLRLSSGTIHLNFF